MAPICAWDVAPPLQIVVQRDRVLRVARLVFRSNDVFVHDLVVVLCQLLRPELEGQLGDLTGKVERHLVIVVVHWRASVHADVEGLVYRHDQRAAMLLGITP
jgi:hypothetical protein